MMVWQQKRSVQLDGYDLSAFDVDITVANPEDDPLEFELTVWNMDESVFAGIESGERAVSIELGWEDGPSNEVTVGVIERTEREYDGTDVLYRMIGEDASEAVLANRVSDSFVEKTPDTIAAELAEMVGLSAETDNVGQEISTFSVYRQDTIRHHLDRLLDYAGQFTGDTWRYYVQAGTLYFIEDGATRDEIPQLSYDGSLASVSPVEDEEVDDRVEFTALLDPRFTQGAQVRLDTDRFTGNYEVISYEYQSSDVTGDHMVTGILERLGEAQPYEEELRETFSAITDPVEDVVRSVSEFR